MESVFSEDVICTYGTSTWRERVYSSRGYGKSWEILVKL